MAEVAFYRCEVKVISRSAGRSATAAAAYRSAELVHDHRTGEDHDYRRRRGVEHTEVVLPDGTPATLRARSALWNAAEAAEKRKNACVAREAILAMPHQLSQPEQRAAAARDMARWIVERYGTAADIAVHHPDPKADERNYHAHILFTTRRVGPEGFGEKTRELDDRKTGPEEITRIRQGWEEIGNRHLSRAGHEASLDRRSLEDRGIDREPEPKLGPVATEMERKGRRSNAGDDIRAAKARNADLEKLIAERKVIDLAIERAKRQARPVQPAQKPQERREARPGNPAAYLSKRTQDRHIAELGRFYEQGDRERQALRRRLDTQYGQSERRDRAGLAELENRQCARTGLFAWFANISGVARREAEHAADLRANLADIAMRRREAEAGFERNYQTRKQKIEQRHEDEKRRAAEARQPAPVPVPEQDRKTGTDPPRNRSGAGQPKPRIFEAASRPSAPRQHQPETRPDPPENRPDTGEAERAALREKMKADMQRARTGGASRNRGGWDRSR